MFNFSHKKIKSRTGIHNFLKKSSLKFILPLVRNPGRIKGPDHFRCSPPVNQTARRGKIYQNEVLIIPFFYREEREKRVGKT